MATPHPLLEAHAKHRQSQLIAAWEAQHGTVSSSSSSSVVSEADTKMRHRVLNVLGDLARAAIHLILGPQHAAIAEPLIRAHAEVSSLQLSQLLKLPELQVRSLVGALEEIGAVRRIERKAVNISSGDSAQQQRQQQQQSQPLRSRHTDDDDDDAKNEPFAVGFAQRRKEKVGDRAQRRAKTQQAFYFVDYRRLVDEVQYRLIAMRQALETRRELDEMQSKRELLEQQQQRPLRVFQPSASELQQQQQRQPDEEEEHVYARCLRCGKAFDAFGASLGRCDTCGGELEAADPLAAGEAQQRQIRSFNEFCGLIEPLLARALQHRDAIPEVDHRIGFVTRFEPDGAIVRVPTEDGMGGQSAGGAAGGDSAGAALARSRGASYSWEAASREVTVKFGDDDELRRAQAGAADGKAAPEWLESHATRQRAEEAAQRRQAQEAARSLLSGTVAKAATRDVGSDTEAVRPLASSVSRFGEALDSWQPNTTALVDAVLKSDPMIRGAEVKREQEIETATPAAAGQPPPLEAASEADVAVINVGGQEHRFLDVTEELQMRMAEAEYAAYAAMYARLYGDEEEEDVDAASDGLL